jgi:hypothetical protein
MSNIVGIPVWKGRGFSRDMRRLLFAAALAAEGRFPLAKEAAEKRRKTDSSRAEARSE